MSKLAALYRTASWPLRVVGGTLIVLGVSTILLVGLLTAAGGGDIKE